MKKPVVSGKAVARGGSSEQRIANGCVCANAVHAGNLWGRLSGGQTQALASLFGGNPAESVSLVIGLIRKGYAQHEP